MTHAIRARHVLLTSLGLLPLACSAATGTGSDDRDLEAGNQGSSRPVLAECGASVPLGSGSVEGSWLGIGLPRQVREVDPGLSLCESGVIHRPEPVTCESVLPRAPMSEGDAGAASVTQFELLYGFAPTGTDGSAACSADADCTVKPFGYCAPDYRGVPPSPLIATCNYGCVVDADCGAGFV